MSRILYLESTHPQRPAPSPTEPGIFHRALGVEPSPLLPQPKLAGEFGVAHLDLKLETDRLGLPSFKIMGASWASIEALRPVLPPWWTPRHGLAPLAGELPDLTLIAATDGNHGRAVAHVARMLGLRSRILVPEVLEESRLASIRGDGAEVAVVSGNYDETVARSAAEAEEPGYVLVSDTSWPGYERVPASVIDGYSTILWEAEQQLEALDRFPPDLVLVQLGVGSFGAAVIRHFQHAGRERPRIVGVEPVEAACVMASLAAQTRVTIPGSPHSVMAGLNCGTPSLVAWPLLRGGFDAVLAMSDDAAIRGVQTSRTSTSPSGNAPAWSSRQRESCSPDRRPDCTGAGYDCPTTLRCCSSRPKA